MTGPDSAYWVQVDPGSVVIVSESEIGFTGSWTCNAERMRAAYYPSSIAITLERQTNSAKKMCGIGDCGVGFIEGEGSPAASLCRRTHQLREPIDGRRLIVNGQ